MEYPPDQFTYHACQIALVSIDGTSLPARRVTISYSRRDDLIAYLNMTMAKTVLPDDAEDRDGGSNG